MDSMTCTKCGETKSLERFTVDRSRKSGQKNPCKSCKAKLSAAWERKNPDKAKAKAARRPAGWCQRQRRRLRSEILNAYGAQCACCGESTPEFLTIDHINNDGADHRREIKTSLYRWLKARGFPKHNYQLLCFNCNCAKGIHGECPHKRGLKRAA